MHNPETLIISTLVIGGYCVLYALPMLWAIRARERAGQHQAEHDETTNELA